MYAFLSNYRAMLLRPSFETPVDTAEEILNRGMIPFVEPVSRVFIDILSQSTATDYQQLAKKCVLTKDHDEVMKLLAEGVHGAGTHVFLFDPSKFTVNPEYEELGEYHLSSEVLQGVLPFLSWVVDKRWTLNEALAVHILRFQQVKE